MFADKHVDIGTCHSVNNFRFTDSLNFLSFPLIWRNLVLESVGPGFASICLLDGTNYKIKLLLAHLFLQISESLLHNIHDCFF